MRMGYEFWEEFWKWLLKEGKDPPYIPDDIDLDEWLKNKYNEFEELWMSGQVEVPPLRETLKDDIKNKIAFDFIIHKEIEAEFLKYADSHHLMKIFRLPPKR